MPSISLIVQPTSGTAPFIVNTTATIAGPFQGYIVLNVVDVTYTNRHKDEPNRIDIEDVNAPEGSTDISFPEMSAGTSGHTYKFYGFLEDETGQLVASSEPVTVTVS